VRPAALGDAHAHRPALRPFVVDDPGEILKEELRVVPAGEGVLAQAVSNMMRLFPAGAMSSVRTTLPRTSKFVPAGVS
jgi:hypothetical protein